MTSINYESSNSNNLINDERMNDEGMNFESQLDL